MIVAPIGSHVRGGHTLTVTSSVLALRKHQVTKGGSMDEESNGVRKPNRSPMNDPESLSNP